MRVPKTLKPLQPYVRTLRQGWRSARALFGRFPRECTVCGHKGYFFAYGYPLAADAMCPRCLSLERHRLLVLCDRERQLFKGREILHFAPEPCMRSYIGGQAPKRYTTCDLFADEVDLKINIEQIDLPDGEFDLVVCSHVLEHVDDRKALPELFRITRSGGTVIAMFPIVEGWDTSYEDRTVSSEADRLLYFGQRDHVRFYGRDARQRLTGAGFEVTEWTAMEPFVSRYGLLRGEKIFLCRKP
jgi:SAM-dependent methyltransferase